MSKVIRYGPMLFLLGLMFSLANVGSAWALGTHAGTVITNQATATYKDANGNNRDPAASNTVSITVKAVAAVDVSPATNRLSTQLGGTAYHPIDITNQGNDTDTLTISFSELAQRGADTWTLGVYSDVNRNGVFDTGTDTLIVSGTSASVPSNFDIKTMAADSTFKVIYAFTTPTVAVRDDSLQMRLTATTKVKSNGSATDSGDYTTIVQAADPKVAKGNNKTGGANVEPGDEITYQIILSNDGNDTSYANTLLDTLQTSLVNYVASSMRKWNDGPPAGTVDAAYAIAGAKTDGTDSDSLQFSGGVLSGDFGKMAPGDSITVYFRVTVRTDANSPATISNKAWNQWKNKNLVSQPPVPSPPKDNPLLEVNGINLQTVRTGVDSVGAPDSLSTDANPTDVVKYQLRLVNTGNGEDSFTLSKTSTGLPDSVVFYADADSNGIADGGPITTTGILAEGANFRFVAYVYIPVGASDGARDSTFVTGTSDEDGTKTDTVKLTTTVTAPVLSVIKRVPVCL